MHQPVQTGRARRSVSRAGRSAAALLSAATAGGIIASAFLVSMTRRPADPPLRRLAAAVGPHRVVRARLTGGFAYAPCEPAEPDDSLVAGLACGRSDPGSWAHADALSRLAAELRASERAGARRSHVSGAWHVVWSDADAAVRALQTAARSDPASAAIQNDLAVALLQRAEADQDPLSILDAYTAVDSAVRLDPRLPEARFNRAITLERLYLRADAVQAWMAYLEMDDASPWAGEARARLDGLRAAPPSWDAESKRMRAAIARRDQREVERIVARFPWRARERSRAALVEWAAAQQAGDSGSAALIEELVAVGRALRRTTGDAQWADVASEVAAAAASPGAGRLAATAHAVAAYARGRADLERLALDSAQRWLGIAERDLAELHSAATYWARYDLARVSYQRHTSAAYDEALRRLRLVLGAAPGDYRTLRALTTRTVGFVESIRANFDIATSAFTAAIREGNAVGEPILELRTATDAARLAATLRGERAGWAQLYRAFRSSPRYPDAPSDAQRLFRLAAALSWKRSPAVAPLYQREFVRLASLARDSLLTVSALTKEAELLARQRRTSDALAALRQVEAYAAGIERDSIRALMLTDADLVHAQVLLHDRPDSAVRLLRKVVARYGETQYLIQVGRAKLLLASAYAATGAGDSARVAFEDALAETERQRADLAAFEDRAQFLDQARPVIDTVVRFLIDQHDTTGALEFLERMRARVLLERASRTVPAHALDRPIAAVRSMLTPQTTILSYAVLDDELVSWSVRADGVSMVRTRFDGGLQSLVERFTALIAARADDAEIRSVAARLYTLLIAPLDATIPNGARLVVVPDKWLHFVPFAALFDEHTRRFLVESRELSVAPSIRLFADAAARYDSLRAAAAPTVLVVGNPAFDRGAYALPSLPGAEREARRVADVYPRSRLLVGAAATKRAFVEQAASADVIHFAGHGVISPDAPMLSQLVLAPDADGRSGGALYAKDLFAMSLPRTRLAILSGCHTASGELSGTEGASSLARALFAAGVPAVIASLWAVDDVGTAEFFTSFHRELSHDGDPVAALRRAQLGWLSRERDGWRTLSVWAAFQTFGAAGGARPVGSSRRNPRVVPGRH